MKHFKVLNGKAVLGLASTLPAEACFTTDFCTRVNQASCLVVDSCNYDYGSYCWAYDVCNYDYS